MRFSRLLYKVTFSNDFCTILGPLGVPFGRPWGVLGDDFGALGATKGHFGALKRPFLDTTSS